ncbi:MAG: OmpA family protein [Marinoscillum sp.]
MKKLTLGICLILLNAMAFGQSKRQQLKKMAVVFYQEDFKEVLDLCVKLEKEYPKEEDHYYYKYITQHLTINRGGDLSDLTDFESSRGKTDKFYNYWLGRIHLSRYEFEDASEHLQAFMDLDVYKSPVILRETREMLKTAKDALPYYNDPDDYEIERLPEGINSIYSEISPAFFNGHDELVFASNRHPKDSYHESETYTIYHSEKKGTVWSDPAPLLSLGSFSYENAKIEVINEDKRLYFYSPENGGGLYFSEFDEVSWGIPREFDSNLRNRHIESHFFINDAENYILFVSKDKDILETRLVDDKWSNPQPVSGNVNSIYSEESPFLSHSGDVLYFSSNRPGSMGGYDVFRSVLDPATKMWGKPENMGFPINTIDDDINFEVTPSDQSGYLSSNRLHAVGGYDIYYFHKIDKIEVTGTVFNSLTNSPAPGIEVRFKPKVYTDEIFRATTNQDGIYKVRIFNRDQFDTEVNIGGNTLARGEFESYIPTDEPNLIQNFTVAVPEHLQPKTNYATLYQGTREDESIDLEMIGNKFRGGRKAVINNIYFDFHSFRIKPESREVLSKLYVTMLKSPDLVVEIGGHTDSVGDDQFNLKLSQQRADAVRGYLIKEGIDPQRLIARGYGETVPLASNDDEENGRELNRRIEIRVLE